MCIIYKNTDALDIILSNYNINDFKKEDTSLESIFTNLFKKAISSSLKKTISVGMAKPLIMNVNTIKILWDYAKDYINLHTDSDYCFKTVCINNKKEIINYLIFDCNIKQTPEITRAINESNNAQEYHALFEKRDTYDKLNEELNTSQTKSNKNKI